MKKGFLALFTSPILWGGAAGFGFYALIREGLIRDELIIRYTAGHPVEYITVCLFLIGMVSLFFKFLRIGYQRRKLALGPIFPPIKAEKEPTADADNYLKTLKKTAAVRGESLHISRLRRALQFLKSGGRVDDLDQELRCLADDDAMAAESDYGMVKMFIWAIPILGFLGTVIGITAALGNLNLTELETTGKLLASGLKIAFDTTALALSLVFVLYFTLFFVQRTESKLFVRLECLIDRELQGRFLPASSPLEEEELNASRKILKSISDSFDKLMQRQTEIWETAMEHAAEQNDAIIQHGADQIQGTLRSALSDTLSQHARLLSQGEEKLIRETITPVVQEIQLQGKVMSSLQEQMIEESKVLRELLHANGEIARLENRLNQNLQELAEAGRFTETVNALAAAIHLLNGKLKTPLRTDEGITHLSELSERTRLVFPDRVEQTENAEETETEERGGFPFQFSLNRQKKASLFNKRAKSA